MKNYSGEGFMKRNIKNFLVKAFSMCLAFILVFPTNLFAMGLDNARSRKYNASASIMGLAQTETTGQNEDKITDQTLLETEITSKETDKYLIEKYARLSKTTGQIEYLIKAHPKDEESKDQVTTSFAVSKNTDLEDLKIEKISQVHSDKTQTEIKYQEQRPSILYNNDAFETLGVTTDKADLVYYLSAKLSEESLAKIDDKTPTMDLDINIAEAGANTYQDRYALSIEKMDLVDEDGEYTIETLKEKEDAIHQISAIYKEGNSNLLGENPGEIVWADFIHADDDKEFTTDIKLDEAQDATDSQIRVEFYQANEKGYTLKEDFTKEIPFTESLKLQIPLGFIAKVELKTKATGNANEYSLNQTKIPNPIYKEEKTEEKSEEEDADPLPEESPNTEESKDASEEKIIPIDPETNEAVIDHSLVKEDTKEESEPTKEETSAINLNRDSVINNFKNKDKLNPVVEIIINNISSLFNAYNNDEMTYEEFLANLKTQASDLSKDDFAEIIKGLIAGLNQETYKVANIDEDQLLAEVYGKDEAEEAKPATEEKPVTEVKEADTGETTNAENDNVETKTTEDFRTPEDKIKDNALESFDKSLNQAKEASKKPQEDDRSLIGNISEGIKGIFGQSNLQKADQELKAALAEGKSLEEIQAILLDLGKRYELNSKDEAKLMADNEDAIKGLIARDADQNFSPSMLMAKANENANPLDSKKFTIRTRFDTSTALGDIQAGQFFKIHLDEKLTVKEGTTLDPIKYNGEVIANPKYDSTNNTIVYTIAKDITENIQFPLEIPVDYNIGKITPGQDFTVINKISGLGVTDPKELPPERIDKNGNPVGTIVEAGGHDVIEIIEPDSEFYKFNMDANSSPVVNNGELIGFNWTIRVTSDKDLKSLGYKINFTTVEGSGLGDIESRNTSISLDDQLDQAFGIVDSKHHNPTSSTFEITYDLYTPITDKQGSYMLDLSVMLSVKGKVGAERIVANEGYPDEVVDRITPTRVSMNNRTSIKGEFTSNETAKWTITDGVSTGDTNNGLPLESRTLANQTFNSGKTATYGLDADGNMVVKSGESTINSLPEAGANPQGSQAVGNIAVYQVATTLNNPKAVEEYSVSGVRISKYRDIYVDQKWGLPEGYNSIPAQTLTVKDKAGNVLGSTPVDPSTGYSRAINIPNVKFWDIDNNGNASMIDHKIEQTFDPATVTDNNKDYKYVELGNYYNLNLKNHYIYNRLDEVTEETPATFTVIKVDSKNPEKRLAGAKYYLLGAEVEVTTDNNGEATFSNIKPGTYTLKETQAPAGYKLDQDSKYITISNDGKVSVQGNNAQYSNGSGQTDIVEHSDYPNWKDFMNTQHYGNIDQNGKLEFYVYLKPYAPRVGGSTDKDTTFNISIPGVDLADSNITVYNVDPYYRNDIFDSMNAQNVDQKTSLLGSNVLNADHTFKITGKSDVENPLSGNNGYQIYLPKERFGTDWGFLVKVSANVGDKDSTTLSYDWLAAKDPSGQSKIRQNVSLSKATGTGHPTLTITNEEYKKSNIEVSKYDSSKTKLPGAEFVLKNADGRVIANVTTDDNGDAKFGQFPPGTYYLEESKAPAGYERSNVYFVVTVDENGKVTYKAKFINSDAIPALGSDYYLEKTETSADSDPINVISVNQNMYINDAEGRGYFTGIWEAYRLESLKWTLDASLSNVGPGKTLEIQFDQNLDFTQYFKNFPNIEFQGKVIAEPHFDYKTNLLTYVFNDNSKSDAETNIHVELKGMIPSKFYQLETGTSSYTNIVAPGKTGVTGNQSQTIRVPAYYEGHDNHKSNNNNPTVQNADYPSQSYYFRDIYQADDGQWYVKAIAYYNPLGNYDYTQDKATNNIYFNWIFTDWSEKAQPQWEGKYEAPFDLRDVKVYRTDFPGITKAYPINGDYDKYSYVNKNMPLSYGVVPENDPNTYELVYSSPIDPSARNYYNTQGDISLKYNAANINPNSMLTFYKNAPLELTMPAISSKQEGYVIEQTFSIRDIDAFNSHWRAFSMTNGPAPNNATSLKSTFVNAPNPNFAHGDQVGVELPKTYKEVVGIINKKYEPGSFTITKLNGDTKKTLQGASFILTDENNNSFIRSSDANGQVLFKDLAPGKYRLKEYRAPANFTMSKEEWQVTVYRDGNVKIESLSITGGGTSIIGTNINIDVENKPSGQDFRIYKKDDEGNGLAGAVFTLTKEGETTPTETAISNANGVVSFAGLEQGTYEIIETKAPDGYKPINKKWVLVIDENGNKKVYNYSLSDGTEEMSLLDEEGTYRINVKDRPQDKWGYNDNRITGWTNKSTEAKYLGTRIIAINKDQQYVIQRYVINPEAAPIEKVDGADAVTSATIHREKPSYTNMDWYNGEDFKVFTLEPKENGNTDGKVTGFISDLRLADYTVTDITTRVEKSVDTETYPGESRLKLEFPSTDKPIVVDVKIPYKSESEGVGTGIDVRENYSTYWKSDYYESVSDIVPEDLVSDEKNTIVGSYIGEDSLDVTNQAKTYGFKIKKVKDGATATVVPGATFKLTGGSLPDTGVDVTSKADGTVEFTDLKPGQYTLEETEAAPGYEKTNKTWTVTIDKEGKAWIKENTSQEEPINEAMAYSADSQDLEIGDDLVSSPQRAGDGWEAIDPTITSGESPKANLAADNGAPVTTKITEINKGSKRFRQEFVYSPAPYKNGVTKRNIQIHRQPESYDLLKADTNITVYQNINGVNKDITSSISFKESKSPLRLVADIPATVKGTLTVKVETKYDPNKGIGLGTNYDSHVGATGSYTPHNSWVAYSYSNEARINKRTTFNIKGYSSTGGSVTANTASSEAGKAVTLNVSPQTGYRLKEGSLKVTDANGDNVNVSKNQFIMPASDVTISAEFEKIPESTYKVTFSAQENGTVTAKPNENIKAGDTVNLTVTPNEGYVIEKLYYKDGLTTNEHTIENNSFVMPASSVVVYATFKQKTPPTPTKHNVKVASDIQNGSVTASPTSAAEGETVKVTVTPNEGFEIASVNMNGQALTADANGQYKFTMPANDVTLSATFKQRQGEIKPPSGSILIEADGYKIINKQTGLNLKIFKKDKGGYSLKDAEFTLVKYTDQYFETVDDTFKQITVKSDENGNVNLVDSEGNPINLETGYYRLTEIKSPLGYKQAQAPWDIEVYEEAGQLKAKYKSAEYSEYEYLDNDVSYATTDLKTAENGIKYKSKLTYINTESKTYVQRIYIDTRGYNGSSDKINIQITPKYKREELDHLPGDDGPVPPDTLEEGVKTAYRSTYKITGGPTSSDENAFANNVLENYDLSKNNVTMLNTARWRPFDWGFDEDIMNLDRGGIYYIDVEGFYDDAIITGIDSKQDNKKTILDVDLKKLELNFDFYDGAREFQQAVGRDEQGNIKFEKVDKGSYQQGNINLGLSGGPEQGEKYINALSKTGGRIYPAIGENEAKTRVSTSIDLSGLYVSENFTEVPRDGMTILNEKETYNITFSKHGLKDPKQDIESEEVTKNRLEGAIFRLEKELGSGIYVPVEGSYVGSAFNGYFGFRGLEPGRYRLIEVKAPEGYNPIKDPLLYFTIKTVNANSGEVVDPETGETIDIKEAMIRFTSETGEIHRLGDLQMEDPNDSTRVVDISSVPSKDINIETAMIVNPETQKAQALKDLIVVGEEKYKDDGSKYRNEYPIRNIKIVPKSSGYISLEYDEANGVYQYLPEKTTSEKDGKLIDFVTGATAKNMGKIINEVPGEGEVTVNKVDQDGNAIKASDLLPGAKFRLTRLTAKEGKEGEETKASIQTKIVGADGTLTFDKLPIGNYRLEEIESPAGYVNTGQVWNFTIGGEGLDPYSGPIARTGRDLSSQITLDSSTMRVINPDTENNTPTAEGQIHPHYGESMEFTNEFSINPGTKINPGDYFVLKMSNQIDLNGIFEYEIENLDIFADGVGTIAKADYDRQKRIITYTFTDYAKTYELLDFSNKLTAFIDLYKVKNSDGMMSSQHVGFGIGKDTSKYSSVKVVYDLDYAHEKDYYGNDINMVSKIVKYNPKTGEFLHYYYINRLKQNSDVPIEWVYSSDQNIENLNISYTSLVNNWDVSMDMPESFGVNEYSNNLYQFTTARSINYLSNEYYTSLNFENGLTAGQSVIIKVTGRVADLDKSEYVGYGDMYEYTPNFTPTHAHRVDEIRYFKNEATAKATLSITAINPENNIDFSKVDQNGKALAGATFQLQTWNTDKNTWENERDPITTRNDGLFGYTKLKPGKYQLLETKAPDGYKPATGPVALFEVDRNGKIVNTVSDEGEGKELQPSVGETGKKSIPIINKKEETIDFTKVDAENNARTLEGAEFEVWYKADENGAYTKDDVKLYQNEAGDKLVLNADEKAPAGYTKVNVFTTGADGKLGFKFYDPGYYALKETKAPNGYGKPTGFVYEFRLVGGKIQTKQTEGDSENYEDIDSNNPINIENKKSTFPLTGGNGVFIGFAIIGTAVMLLALAYFGIYQNDKNRRRSARYKK